MIQIKFHRHRVSAAVQTFLILANDCQVIGIDEAQFFDEEIVEVCNNLANRGIRVIIAGLDMDYQGNPFGPMPALMATAEYVTKVHALFVLKRGIWRYTATESQIKRVWFCWVKKIDYEPLSRAAFF